MAVLQFSESDSLMMIHPQFDPIALSLGPLAIRWYALSYIVGFVLFIWLGRRRIKQGNSIFTAEMLDDFLTWGILGVILGGRLGFVLFYQPAYYLAHPMDILKVWEGGMSFHGGFLGVLVATWLFARKHQLKFLQTTDFIVPLVPLGLASPVPTLDTSLFTERPKEMGRPLSRMMDWRSSSDHFMQPK